MNREMMELGFKTGYMSKVAFDLWPGLIALPVGAGALGYAVAHSAGPDKEDVAEYKDEIIAAQYRRKIKEMIKDIRQRKAMGIPYMELKKLTEESKPRVNPQLMEGEYEPD